MKVLLTGFEPFGDWVDNPSARIAAALDGRQIGVARVVGAVLPVVWAAAGPRLQELLEREEPDLLLSLGLGGGSALAVERVALNVDDSLTPDNAGEVIEDRPIDPSGPAAYFATLPVKAIVGRLREEGIPAVLSNSAGTFLCNHVMYCGLHLAAAAGRPIMSGFIHLPPTPEMAATARQPVPSLGLELQTRGIEVALAIAAEWHA
jgi:pyroglutamyl-peptidase